MPRLCAPIVRQCGAECARSRRQPGTLNDGTLQTHLTPVAVYFVDVLREGGDVNRTEVARVSEAVWSSAPAAVPVKGTPAPVAQSAV